MAVDRTQTGLGDRVDELGRRAEQGDADLVGEIEHGVAVGVERRTVVEHDAGAGAEARHEPVPHHPAGGREVEGAVAGAHVAVEQVLGEVLEQHPAGTVDDALRRAGRARAVEHVPRVVEREPYELRLGLGAVRHHVVERRHALGCVAETDARHHPRGPQARQPGDDVGERTTSVEGLAAVLVAVAGDEHRGLDLTKTVEHAVDTEVGRRRRERGADGRGGEHHDDVLGAVRQPRRHTIPDAHSGIGERSGALRDGGAQLGPAPGPSIVGSFGADDQRRLGGAGQQGLGDVERRVREEAGVAQLSGGFDDGVALVADHSAEVPGRGPERCGFGDRPGMELFDLDTDAAGERRHVRVVDGGRPPQDLFHVASRGSARLYAADAVSRSSTAAQSIALARPAS